LWSRGQGTTRLVRITKARISRATAARNRDFVPAKFWAERFFVARLTLVEGWRAGGEHNFDNQQQTLASVEHRLLPNCLAHEEHNKPTHDHTPSLSARFYAGFFVVSKTLTVWHAASITAGSNPKPCS
jgi:hypothetical protein